jgi:RimJ/RimL family protein N-acetyltransferase
MLVRPLLESDIPYIISYWRGLSHDDIERMGIASENLPPEDSLRMMLLNQIQSTEPFVQAFSLIWTIEERPVGYSTLKDIKAGESGSIHLHMWESQYRGKGYGAKLFCMAVVDLYKRFSLNSMICEPKSTNPMPNRMLQKIGFPLIKTYVGKSSELSSICELNQYGVELNIAQKYLEREQTG